MRLTLCYLVSLTDIAYLLSRSLESNTDEYGNALDRGQGYQHAITDVKNYVDALVKIRDSPDTNDRQEIMSAFDTEMIERTGKAVKQSLQEAAYSMNIETVSKMLMATHGHGRSA